MTTTPLLVDGGAFYVTTDAWVTPQDFSDAIDSITISVEADEVEIPQTLATPKTARLGARTYKVEIKYLSNDTSLTDELFSIFWAAVVDGDGTLEFAASLRDEAVSATNPQWQGTLVVTSAAVGADVGALSEGSGTFTLTAEPVRATTDITIP